MISGIVSQGAALPRGVLASSGAYFDLETIATPAVTGADSQVASCSGLYVDADGFFATRFARALVPPLKVDDSIVFAPRVRSSQVLQPVLYVAVDVLLLPAVALPGILQAHLLVGDDAVLVPFISTHGSLRPVLHNAFDAVFAPTVVAAQTLRPNLYTSADVFHAPTARVGVRPLRVTDNDVVYAITSTGGTLGLLTSFDGVAVNATVSGGGLIATHSNSVDESGARSAANKTGGKYFFEMTVNVTHGANDSQGILLSASTYGDMCSNGRDCFAVDQFGGIYSNNGSPANFPAHTVGGDVLCFAIDLTTRLGWVRKNGGNWNNDGTANPATGVGGFTLGAGAFAPAVGFGGSGTASGDAATANFGQSTYAYAAPAGFGNWTA